MKFKPEMSVTHAQFNHSPPHTDLLLQHFPDLAEIPGGIPQLRQLILQLAVQGKLTEDWRQQHPDVEPAGVLLERIKEEKARLVKEGRIKAQKPLPPIREEEVPFEVSEVWEIVRLGDITNYGISEKAESKQVGKNVWVLELEDIEKETSKVIKKVYHHEKDFKSTKNVFKCGDVLYGKLRPYLDKVVVAEEDGVCTTEIVPFNGYLDIDSYYLRLVMKTKYFIDYANSKTHGMNLPRLGTDNARLATIPLPPLAEQQEIVTRVEQLLALCDRLEAAQQQRETIRTRAVRSNLAALDSAAGDFSAAWSRVHSHFPVLIRTVDDVVIRHPK